MAKIDGLVGYTDNGCTTTGPHDVLLYLFGEVIADLVGSVIEDRDIIHMDTDVPARIFLSLPANFLAILGWARNVL